MHGVATLYNWWVVYSQVRNIFPHISVRDFPCHWTNPNHWSLHEIAFVFEVCEVLNELHVCSLTSLTVLYDSDSCFQELRRSDSINQVRGHHKTSILHPKRWFLIQLNCAKLKFVSYTSDLSEQMHDFQKRTMLHLMYILNPQDLLQNRSLEKVPVCIVWQCFPHDNTVCIHMYDESKR